jgi:hypothetical protein
MLYEQAAYQAAARRQTRAFLAALNNADLSRIAAAFPQNKFDDWWLTKAIAEEQSRRRERSRALWDGVR